MPLPNAVCSCLFVGLTTTYGEGCIHPANDATTIWLLGMPRRHPSALTWLVIARCASTNHPRLPPTCAAFHLAMLQLKQVVVKVRCVASDAAAARCARSLS